MAIWIGAEAYSGWPAFRCAQYLLDPCKYGANYSACQEEMLNAFLGWGAGKVVPFLLKSVGAARRIFTSRPLSSVPKPELRFTQTTASPFFDKDGKFASETIGSLSKKLRSGLVSPDQVPVQILRQGDYLLVVNTRSSLALRRVGIPVEKLNIIDKTEDAIVQNAIRARLTRNKLGEAGADRIRITGSGSSASNLQ